MLRQLLTWKQEKMSLEIVLLFFQGPSNINKTEKIFSLQDNEKIDKIQL